jgi:hypothetical protein
LAVFAAMALAEVFAATFSSAFFVADFVPPLAFVLVAFAGLVVAFAATGLALPFGYALARVLAALELDAPALDT